MALGQFFHARKDTSKISVLNAAIFDVKELS
ncbi:hypothetical protein NSE_0425 [Neorickettsia sennetsu str. Miyayama]|uniref:Uncharacterized protein n=1 Tax=Ehrlichia sennetsu (strain ATCC VR-367 / Miyayama) TaxID=222891 RepID=Q2GDY5_EHRS3|nr:hypothetical protein NSE_0425 [Neorickettsia sennetsu str. Miyayama]